MWVLVVIVAGYMTIIGTYADYGACIQAGKHEVAALELQGISATFDCRLNRTYRPQKR